MWMSIGGALLALVLAGVALCGPRDAPTRADVARAGRTAAPASAQGDALQPLAPAGWLAAAGIVEPADRELRVAPAEAGLIERVSVAEGDRVAAGQPLFELEHAVESAEVARAEADLAAARAQLGRAEEGVRPEDRRAAAAEAEAARARAELSRRGAMRSVVLAEGGAAPEEQAERAHFQAAADTAAAAGLAERARAAARPWKEDVEVARTALRQAEAALETARARLARRTVRAPAAGTVLQVVIRAGERAEPAGPPLAVLGDLSRVRARLDVDERDVARVQVGQRGYVLAAGAEQARVPGVVEEVGCRMGRKNQRTDEPTERIDTKILEVVLALDHAGALVQGQRVTGYLDLSAVAAGRPRALEDAHPPGPAVGSARAAASKPAR